MAGRLAIRCVSLVGSERRARMAEQLNAMGTPWSFFDACTSLPDDLPYRPERAMLMHGRVLTKGELGCFASHREIWRSAAAADGPEMTLVLEDDLLLNPVFFRNIERVAEEARPYGYLRLYAKVPAGARLEAAFLDRHVARFSGRAYGTQAYFIRRDIAQRFLSRIREVVRPVDDEIDRFWAHGVPIRSVFPFPVMEVDLGSTIEPVRREQPTPEPGIRLRWRSIQAMEKVRRHLADVRARVRH